MTKIGHMGGSLIKVIHKKIIEEKMGFLGKPQGFFSLHNSDNYIGSYVAPTLFTSEGTEGQILDGRIIPSEQMDDWMNVRA